MTGGVPLPVLYCYRNEQKKDVFSLQFSGLIKLSFLKFVILSLKVQKVEKCNQRTGGHLTFIFPDTDIRQSSHFFYARTPPPHTHTHCLTSFFTTQETFSLSYFLTQEAVSLSHFLTQEIFSLSHFLTQETFSLSHFLTQETVSLSYCLTQATVSLSYFLTQATVLLSYFLPDAGNRLTVIFPNAGNRLTFIFPS
jgi:hypothetical protein